MKTIYIKKYGGGNYEAKMVDGRTLYIKYNFEGKFASQWTVSNDEEAKSVIEAYDIKKDAINNVRCGSH